MTVLLAVLFLLAFAAPAQAATADELLRDLAANQTHSWVDDDLSFDEMVERYEAGERLFVTCGNVAEVARRLLRREGHRARVVQTITTGEFDYFNDGHLMLEVWLDDRWQLYDLDANVRAVDEEGRGVSVVDQVQAVKTGTARWEVIADDPLTNAAEPDPQLRELAERTFADPAAFYERVMGVALLPSDPNGSVSGPMFYGDAEQREHLEAYTAGWRTFAAPAIWEMLVTSTETYTRPPAPPVTATVTPTVPAAPTPAPVPPPTPLSTAPPPALATMMAAKPRPCRFRGREVARRNVGCVGVRRVVRRHLRGDRTGTWRCRGKALVRCHRSGMQIRVRVAKR